MTRVLLDKDLSSAPEKTTPISADTLLIADSADSNNFKRVQVGNLPASGGGTVDVVSNVATDTILGRTTAGSGDSEELTPTQVRTLLNVADGATANSSNATLLDRANHTGTQLASTVSDFASAVSGNSAVAANTAKAANATHTGEVTGDTTLTIANAAVTNAKLANMATKTYKGRTSAATGVPEDVSVATLKSDLALNLVSNTSDATKNTAVATLTNKTMTGATNILTASVLKSATTEVNVSSATAPTAGQVLKATSPTAATWQNEGGGTTHVGLGIGGGTTVLSGTILTASWTTINLSSVVGSAQKMVMCSIDITSGNEWIKFVAKGDTGKPSSVQDTTGVGSVMIRSGDPATFIVQTDSTGQIEARARYSDKTATVKILTYW